MTLIQQTDPTPGRVLVIAGSDSGGGAGVQADIKTVTALRGYAATAITAVTVQNTTGVFGVHEIPVDIVEAQARAVLSDIGADAIKTGMLGGVDMVEAVARLLDEAAGVPAVIDPVMIAKGGEALLASSAVQAVYQLLVPRAALLTPNAPARSSASPARRWPLKSTTARPVKASASGALGVRRAARGTSNW